MRKLFATLATALMLALPVGAALSPAAYANDIPNVCSTSPTAPHLGDPNALARGTGYNPGKDILVDVLWANGNGEEYLGLQTDSQGKFHVGLAGINYWPGTGASTGTATLEVWNIHHDVLLCQNTFVVHAA